MLRIALLAYPDNPVGTVFMNTFMKRDIPLCGVILERKNKSDNWNRFIKKINRDGIWTTIKRIYQIFILQSTGETTIQLAEKINIPIHWVDSFNSQRCMDLLSEMNVDILTIASASILKDFIFTKAKKGCLNAHPGWLPTYRGLGANAYALRDGKHPGVSVHFIDKGIDTGPVIVRERIPVLPKDTVARINDRAVARGAVLVAEVIQQMENNSLEYHEISDPVGKHYHVMPYSETTKINRKIKKDFHAFLQNLTD